jgi:hypothetical protein
MKFSTVFFGSLLVAGSLEAALVQNNSGLAGIGVTPAFDQTFASPNPGPGAQVAPVSPSGSSTGIFQYLSLASNGTGLYYDADGAGACMDTKSVVTGAPASAATQTPNITAGVGCISNFTVGKGMTNVASDALGISRGDAPLPSISILFNNPQTSIAFILATNANGPTPGGQMALNTKIEVYGSGADSNTLLETELVHTSLMGGNNFFTFNGDGLIGSVVLSSTGLDETGQGGNATVTPWAALLTDVQGGLPSGGVEGGNGLSVDLQGNTAPEPGTLALFGLGSVAIGIILRRRQP